MKYTKRIAAICMGLVFVISLAGCGKDGTENRTGHSKSR